MRISKLQTWSFWFKMCILLHMVAIIGTLATGNIIGLVVNTGWIVLLYGFVKQEDIPKSGELLS